MRSIYLAVPAILLTVLSTVMLFISSSYWSLGLALGIVALVAIYMLREAIDWKYYLKHPPALEPRVLHLLERVPYYKQLSVQDKIKFRERLALFLLAHEYTLQPMARSDDDESIEAPEDLKAICSIPAIMLLFDQADFLIRNIGRIVFYRHAFPSPAFKNLHHSEWNEEDRVLIFSIPHLQKGVMQPFVYFDLGMYEWSRASKPVIAEPYQWEQFEQDHHVTQAQLVQAIGLQHPDLNAVRHVFGIHASYLKEL